MTSGEARTLEVFENLQTKFLSIIANCIILTYFLKKLKTRYIFSCLDVKYNLVGNF